ncbi:MAG: hypothetical protein KDH15_01570 [Rhodocyclaceae bacterium]|nr:hypothetical protein [Rhodocyclaceae bacterium]
MDATDVPVIDFAAPGQRATLRALDRPIGRGAVHALRAAGDCADHGEEVPLQHYAI